MSRAIAGLPAVSPWLIAAIAVLGLALVIIAVVLLVRQRRRAPRAPEPPSLSSVWGRFVRGLPASARRDPVVVVLGERLAGKSRLVHAALEQGGRPALVAPNAPEDPRLTLYAGRNALVQEISGELLEDVRPEARDALGALWGPVALEAPLVLAVLDVRAPSWSPGGLRRLGALVRDKVDLLTAMRGSPPRVRVCLTHLDEGAEGFTELAALARDAGHTAALAPGGRLAPELSAALAPLDAQLYPGLRALPAAPMGRLTRFLAGAGPRLLAELAPFLEPLLGSRAGPAAPSLDGIVLAGVAEGGEPDLLGDALAIEGAAVEQDARALDRRRKRAAVAAASVVAALLLGVHAWHGAAVDHAGDAVRRFEAEVKRARRAPQRSWTTDAPAREAEAAAADALGAALRPLWPPLRAAFPDGKRDLARAFLQGIRDLYLVPAAQGPDRTRRVYALSLLYASRDDALGRRILRAPEAWAAGLDVPARMVTDYLAWSERPYAGAVAPPASDGAEVSLDDWQRWLEKLEAAMQRDTIAPDELAALQDAGQALSGSADGALEARSLEDVIELLGEARPGEIDAFLGRGAAEQRAPRWVSENWDSLEALLGMVQRASLDVPSAQGKSVRKALDDLAALGRADPGEADLAYPVVIDGRPARTYRASAWSTLVLASRAGRYADAFVGDVRATGRSPFFVRSTDYPAVGAGGLRLRGPTKSLPGTFTARAVQAEVKPALLALDAALDGARVPEDSRAALTGLVREELARYAAGYRSALWDYVGSFRLDVTSPAGLRVDLEDMVGPASWFTDFWATVAENASVDPEGNADLGALAEALAPFQPVVAVMTGEKGKYPALDKYYAVIAPMLPSLDAAGPASPGPAGAPLEDRLPPIGKLGVAVLDVDEPAPLGQVNAWLDGARVLDKALRQPFLAPVELTYALALQSVERTVQDAWRLEIRPIVAPLLGRFPLDPRADAEVSPDELLAAVGPKGTFRTGLDQLLSPVCKRGSGGARAPKSPAGFRAVKVPGEAIELSSWADGVAAVLWDDGGKPRPIAIQVRPQPLPEVRRGARTVATRAFLRSGEATVFGFNQAPSWQPLPVAWWTSSAAGVGLELSSPDGDDPVLRTLEGEGSAWRFYRLLCRASMAPEGAVTWPFDPVIGFDIQPNPWALIVPPEHRGRRCVALVARN
ncbi:MULTISPECIES: hypothetical protein [Sorangium]|uniref:IcmF-related N-terminal domain-containing protein n=1 Tax=Sorangium cellulosum TaxID=56 RepID=A0A4V0NFB9_SORCE|nr:MULTISPECIES: hypothetical protein [Sorangium]AUX29132.1 uncharacterized protein SOCE836_012190 [Sorangium cellulosum]WCQ88523.1 hypothetical protein NQZ70_01201 [Sorangium sp. Soce836]